MQDVQMPDVHLQNVEVSQSPEEKFREYLASRSRPQRYTDQQRDMVKYIFSKHNHFDADQLIEEMKQKGFQVSRATIYRTLPLLTASGLVREMDFGKDFKYYDPNYADHPNHNHIICQDCDKIVEFESEKIEKLENEISHRLGFSVKAHRLQITATCEELKKLGACKKKSG